jgi:hypothetical protein
MSNNKGIEGQFNISILLLACQIMRKRASVTNAGSSFYLDLLFRVMS